AYALCLEHEAHLEEAEDVLLTLIRVGGERLAASELVMTWLRLGRVRRMQSDFERAMEAYTEAGRRAGTTGDQESVLLSRIGRCNVLYFQGNLAEAEMEWRAVRADAAACRYRTGEAHAEHGLGTVLQRRGQPQEGAPHLWRAYELYEDEAARLRVLNDLGNVLLSLGDVISAEKALLQVVRRDKVVENVTNAMIELMHCASFRHDRVSFERWREQCLANMDEILPNVRADYYLKVGIGLARFGSYRNADTNVRQALEIAVSHGLHELVFRVERIRAGLQSCSALQCSESTTAEPVAWTEALKEVSASLTSLSA
ncbi:MAG: hypothetical protein ACREMN_09495, partial [Gemmatimonadales bacterium]